MTTNNEPLYTPGMTIGTLYDKLKTLTAETAATHDVYDMRFPAWGLGFHGGSAIAETENQVAKLLITVPSNKQPKNGDTLLIKTADPENPQVAMIFDIANHPGDWTPGGNAFMVHAVQYGQGIGHPFTPKAPSPAPVVLADGAVNHPPAPPQIEVK